MTTKSTSFTSFSSSLPSSLSSSSSSLLCALSAEDEEGSNTLAFKPVESGEFTLACAPAECDEFEFACKLIARVEHARAGRETKTIDTISLLIFFSLQELSGYSELGFSRD